MERWYLYAALLLLAHYASAQQSLVDWRFSSRKITGNVYEIQVTAIIKNGWHIYAGNAGEGPCPTSVQFTKSPVLQLVGAVREIGTLKKEQSEVFNSEIRYYENRLILVQKLRVIGHVKTAITGRVAYMACDNRQCTPPKTVDFSVGLP